MKPFLRTNILLVVVKLQYNVLDKNDVKRHLFFMSPVWGCTEQTQYVSKLGQLRGFSINRVCFSFVWLVLFILSNKYTYIKLLDGFLKHNTHHSIAAILLFIQSHQQSQISISTLLIVHNRIHNSKRWWIIIISLSCNGNTDDITSSMATHLKKKDCSYKKFNLTVQLPCSLIETFLTMAEHNQVY